MNQLNFRPIQFNLSGIGCWLTIIGLAWLLGAIGLGWLVKSVVLLMLLLVLTPVLFFLGLRFWFQRHLIRGTCPVCATALTGIAGTEAICPGCGTSLNTLATGFERLAEPGTVDVTAVSVVDVTAETGTNLPPGSPSQT
ncbi:MAG: hypothetical protein ACKO5P_09315 [Nodosilinea sp.]